MIVIFAVYLGWLPVATKPIGGSIWSQARYFILPTFVLAFGPMATYLRLTRSAMLEVLDSEYIKLARAKGVSRQAVIWKHAFRNALIQPVTTSALIFASFITGAIFVETIFAWPGLGRLAARATFDNDFPVIAGVVLLFGVIYLTLNFLADLSYALIDPRIRLD
jgi:peptide/nickel transport system permease protein